MRPHRHHVTPNSHHKQTFRVIANPCESHTRETVRYFCYWTYQLMKHIAPWQNCPSVFYFSFYYFLALDHTHHHSARRCFGLVKINVSVSSEAWPVVVATFPPADVTRRPGNLSTGATSNIRPSSARYCLCKRSELWTDRENSLTINGPDKSRTSLTGTNGVILTFSGGHYPLRAADKQWLYYGQHCGRNAILTGATFTFIKNFIMELNSGDKNIKKLSDSSPLPCFFSWCRKCAQWHCKIKETDRRWTWLVQAAISALINDK